MASRSKRKRDARGDEGDDIAQAPPAEKGGRAGEAIFGAIVFFGGGVYGGISAFESWPIALGCGAAGAVLAVVLVWRRETLF